MTTYLLSFLGITPFWVTGFWILARPSLYMHSPGMALTLGTVLGFGIMALTTMTLGILHLLYAQVLWGIIALVWAVVALSGIWKPFTISMANVFQSQRVLFTRRGTVYKAALVLLLMVSGVYMAGSLIPQMGSDALFQHFLLPKTFIDNASLAYIPEIYTGAWPSNIQMLYTFGMLINGQFAANLISAFNAILFSILIFQFLKQHLPPAVALLMALVFLTLPMVLFQVAKAMVDLGCGLFAFSGLLILLDELNHDNPRTRAVALSGVFFGLAAGSKLPALSFLLPALVVMFLAGTRFGMRLAVKNCIILALSCLAVAAPWYLRSLLLTGDPFFPMLTHIMGESHSSATAVDNLMAFYNHEVAQLGRSITDLWKLPLFMLFPETTLDTLDVVERLKPSYPEWTFLSAIFLPFGLVHGLGKRDDSFRLLLFSALFLVLYALIWFFIYPQRLRHLMVVIPFFLLFTGLGIQLIRSQNIKLRNMTHGLCALWLTMAFFGVFYYYAPRFHGIFDNNAFYLKYRRWDGAIRVINDKLNENDVLFTTFYAFTPFYVRASVINMGMPDSLNRLTMERAKDPDVFFGYLKDNKVGYVLHSPDMIKGSADVLESFLENRKMFTLVWKEDELLTNSRTFNVNKQATLYLYKFHLKAQ